MRIAISTIQSSNCGNRLQNYALQEAVSRMGHQVESLQKERPSMLRRSKNKVRDLVKRDSMPLFREFDKNYIGHSEYYVTTVGYSPRLCESYDKFIIGSDQVWNPHFSFLGPEEYLPFVCSEKKIAYAASFGVSTLGDNAAEVAGYLNDISYISMREEPGAAIVERLTGRSVPVVLDPTMLLTPKDWAEISKPPKGLGSGIPFVFKYVLGSDANENHIERIAQELGAIIVNAADPDIRVGPSEFVWLASNCLAVCTDSFHASVFALLHHKPLGIFERIDNEADMSSRFDTLCDLFDAECCRAKNGNFNMLGMNWGAFEDRLRELRTFSKKWLTTALDGDDSCV